MSRENTRYTILDTNKNAEAINPGVVCCVKGKQKRRGLCPRRRLPTKEAVTGARC